LHRFDPTETTSGSRAMWSALIALAIVVVMFGVFYDLSARRDQAASGGPAVTTPQTTGQNSR
jgi:cytochrome c oxidase assembly factor CtaG